MPRHPPCALHSLSQQRQNKSLQKKHHTPTTINEGMRLAKLTLQSINNARVHYADLKQQPHQPPTTPTRRQSGKGGPARNTNPAPTTPAPSPTGTTHHAAEKPALMLQDPTVCQPNPPPPPTTVPHPPDPKDPGGSTSQPAPAKGQASSTIPLVNTTMRPPTNGVSRGVCSLERR